MSGKLGRGSIVVFDRGRAKRGARARVCCWSKPVPGALGASSPPTSHQPPEPNPTHPSIESTRPPHSGMNGAAAASPLVSLPGPAPMAFGLAPCMPPLALALERIRSSTPPRRAFFRWTQEGAGPAWRSGACVSLAFRAALVRGANGVDGWFCGMAFSLIHRVVHTHPHTHTPTPIQAKQL